MSDLKQDSKRLVRRRITNLCVDVSVVTWILVTTPDRIRDERWGWLAFDAVLTAFCVYDGLSNYRTLQRFVGAATNLVEKGRDIALTVRDNGNQKVIDKLADELTADDADPETIENTRQALRALVEHHNGDVMAAVAQLSGADGQR
jgi:hypothetical protein